MSTYLWWPFPTPLGYEILSAMSPAFERKQTINYDTETPDPKHGIILKIDPPGPPVGGVAPDADATWLGSAAQINLGNNDDVYIVGHCSAGVTSLVGEYAKVPQPIHHEPSGVGGGNYYTDFDLPPSSRISLTNFIALVRDFAKPHMTDDAGVKHDFVYQVLYSRTIEGQDILRVYAPKKIERVATIINNGTVRLGNAARQPVIGQHTNPVTGVQLDGSKFKTAAKKLAFYLRDRFGLTAGKTTQVVLWACFSAKDKGGVDSLAKSVKAELGVLGLDTAKVFGTTGKASSSAKRVEGGVAPVLRVRKKDENWKPKELYLNYTEV